MLEQLLVTLDGSEFGEHALPFAKAIAARTGGSVTLSHVLCCDPPTDLLQNTPFQYEGVSMEAYNEQHAEAQKRYLDQKVQELQESLPGARVRGEVLEGFVTEALERHAEEIGADLVVMTTHGRTGFSRTWLGSVADSLVRNSRFPLLVIRPLDDGDSFPESKFEKFLVPLDGSRTGEEILGPAVALGRVMEARFTLFHVVSPYLSMGARLAPLPAGRVDQRLERAEEYLSGVQDRLQGEGIEAETVIESHFAPARAILNAAEEREVDLIAIATHGYTGVKRALLGSVTDKVLRGARWPLLLDRPSTGLES